MKKGLVVIASTLLFLTVAITSNAEMKISPAGVTTPDASASLRLSRSVYSVLPYYNHSVVSGVNFYNGEYYSCGVYGEATADESLGVFGRAFGSYSQGVYGRADGYFAKGVFGSTDGENGTGVYGSSSASNGKGVQGTASGTSGIGVYGSCTDSAGIGVWGNASVKNGTAILGYADGAEVCGVRGSTYGENDIGVSGNAHGKNGKGVYGNGKAYDFYADGEGKNYGPFTGAHEVKFADDMPQEIVAGHIVSATGEAHLRKKANGGICLSSTLPTITLSTKANDKAVFGVLVSEDPLPKDHWYTADEGERFGGVNALGEGRVWVTNRNGNIENGDYVTTSEIPGYGQLQKDDLLHSYTLGKAIETIDWDQVTETVQHEGKTYKRYLLAVVYTSG